MIERVIHGGTELAIIVRRSFSCEGIRFFTADDCTQQIGYMNRPAGYVVEPHVHRPVVRQVHYTMEVLMIRRGRVRVDFYDESRAYLHSRILESGDVILLARGGHGFEMLEQSEIIEVKQGPYAGSHDKDRFAPVSADSLVLLRDVE